MGKKTVMRQPFGSVLHTKYDLSAAKIKFPAGAAPQLRTHASASSPDSPDLA
jgi:hypothetical protein